MKRSSKIEVKTDDEMKQNEDEKWDEGGGGGLKKIKVAENDVRHILVLRVFNVRQNFEDWIFLQLSMDKPDRQTDTTVTR